MNGLEPEARESAGNSLETNSERIADYLAAELDCAPEQVEVRRLTEGHSNLTFAIVCAGRRYVLRQPPPGRLPPSAHNVLREFRVLSLLDGHGARAPRPVLACADAGVIGAPFYLMEYVEGVVLRDNLPPGMEGDDAAGKIVDELVDALAELHEIDWRRAGFGEIASGNGYLARQLGLWHRQWEHNKTRELDDVESIGGWLTSHRPEESAATIVHGDYKIDNVIFALVDGAPRAQAIVDWEMATVGDPLADLGFLTAVWSEPDEDPALLLGLSKVTGELRLGSRAALADRYAERTGRDVGALRWYQVLALWKLAILLEGSYKRRLAGTTDDDWFDCLADGVPTILSRARDLATQTGIGS